MTTKKSYLEEFFGWQSLLMGGLSIFTCLAAWTFTDKSASVHSISQLAFTLAFVVNHPHFLSSYLLLYGDYRHQILRKPRYFWGAVLAPAILIGYLVYAAATANGALMGHMINGMYFLVGWHYVKQVFGCVIVTSAQQKLYYSSWERRLLLTNLFAVWFMSWLKSHTGQQSFIFYGIPHYGLNLPSWTLTAVYALVGLSFCQLVWMHINKYIQDGFVIRPAALSAFLSLYVWYVPTFAHPGFAYLIPFFHSLQYLVFVWMLKKNEVTDQSKNLIGAAYRQSWVKNFLGFASSALITGALAFEFIPKNLDRSIDLSQAGLGEAPFLVAFLLFINIHHYFIDNVIWRSDNEKLKQYLFTPATAQANASVQKARAS